jgi:hypothetical protein
MDPFDELMEGVDRDAEVRAADRAAGRARFGGWFEHPNYLRAYLSGSAILVREAQTTDRLNELAVVCAYTQRHVLELALKTIIGMYYSIADDEDDLAREEHKPVTTKTPSKSATERLSKCHDLDVLLQDLDAARTRDPDYADLPPDLKVLVGEFSKLEATQPSRLRYPSVRDKATRKAEWSFENQVVIPIVEWQGRLEELVLALLGPEDIHAPISTLGQELDAHSHHLTQELYARGLL